MNKSPQIIFINQNFSPKLDLVFEQACSMNSAQDISIICPSDLEIPEACNQAELSELGSKDLENFQEIYIHRCSNPEKFERFCIARWFYLLSYMQRNHLSSVLYVDSDVLVYSNIQKMMETHSLNKCKCGLMTLEQDHSSFLWAASGHTSYWSTEALAEFCRFIIDCYQSDHYQKLFQEKWDHCRKNNINGGISDMTLLYFFFNENKSKILELSKPTNSSVFDYNFNIGFNHTTNRFECNEIGKSVTWKDKLPYFTESETGNLHLAHTIHFQGGAKNRIPEFLSAHVSS
jgi:hypothetical protein